MFVGQDFYALLLKNLDDGQSVDEILPRLPLSYRSENIRYAVKLRLNSGFDLLRPPLLTFTADHSADPNEQRYFPAGRFTSASEKAKVQSILNGSSTGAKPKRHR